MDTLSPIGSAMASLTAATQIAAILRDAGLSLPKDEMRLKLEALTAAIAEAKLSVEGIASVLCERDQTVKCLQDKLDQAEELMFLNNLY